MKTVLVTGGSGFLGSNLCRRLIREKTELFVLIIPIQAEWKILQI